ncbi:MAG: lysophospholipid acyltransferase family protein [Clostridia bacterium]|nr:lysophospholipid acyltransferase family protein [Clostridia bacterium]
MFYKFAKIIVSVILKLMYNIEVQGLDNIPKKGPCIVFSNHISYLDPLVIGITLERQIFFMAKKELYKNPIMRFILNHLGAFPVSRGKGDIGAIKNSLKVLRRGDIFGIFPEGTRSKNKNLKKLEPGIALIALRSKAPLIPIYIKTDYKLFSKVSVNIGKPINLDGYKGKNQKEMLDDISQYILDQLMKLGE